MHRALIAGVTLLALAGCGTVAGFGRDVTAVGNALTSASNDAARPAPAKRQVAAKPAAKKTTATKVAAKSTAARPAARKTTATKVSAKAPANKKTVVAQPAKVETVETGKPFKPGK